RIVGSDVDALAAAHLVLRGSERALLVEHGGQRLLVYPAGGKADHGLPLHSGDQAGEQRLRGGDHLRGSLVGLLVLDQASRLLVEVDAGRALLGAGGLVVEAGLGGEVVARHAAGEADLVGEVRIGAHRRGAAAVEHAGIGQPGEVQRVAVVVEAAAVLRHAETVAAGRRAGEAEAPAVELDRRAAGVRAGGAVAGAVGDGVAAA